MKRTATDIRIGFVHLRVSNLDRLVEFYTDLLGFDVAARHDGTAHLAAAAKQPVILIISESRNSRPRPAGTTGLYHVAFRLPSRRELARVFLRLYRSGYPLQGFSDHGVSEAIYLADPDGNGLELYWDRPARDWPVVQGRLAMIAEPLDIEGLVKELPAESEGSEGHPAETVIGHIHLQVSNLSVSETFYNGTLRFDVTQRSLPGALFLSSGGYHHHIGLNTWAGRGAPAPPADSLGMASFSILFPDRDSMEEIVRRTPALVPSNTGGNSTSVGQYSTVDPDGISIVLMCAPRQP